MCGCHALNLSENPPITKTVIVRPVEYGNGEAVEAVAEFLGAAEYFSLSVRNKAFDAPLNWITEWRRDGAMRITWTSRRRAKEKLYLTEAGFHPVEIPLSQATVIGQKNEFTYEPLPITVRMTGNSAYLPKADRVSYRSGVPRIKKLP